MKQLKHEELLQLTRTAVQAKRRRSNCNIHTSLEDRVQRLCLAFEPGTYVHPHRHVEIGCWELLTALEGQAAVLTFAEDGIIGERAEISPSGPVRIVEIPPGAWHTIVAQIPGTILLEVKPGPYIPVTEDHRAAWAPQEGAPDAAAAEQWFQSAAPGDRWVPSSMRTVEP